MTFEEFATARLPALLRYALMLTGDPHSAADLVQDTMVNAQVRWHRVRAADQPERYVYRMITNRYLDLRRGPWWRRVLPKADPVGPTRAAPGDHAQASADRDELWALLATLPRQQRAALVLRYYEGLADAEIADVLRCGVGAVRAYVSRGLATLRAQLTAVPSEGGAR